MAGILVPYDFSKTANKALQQAIHIAAVNGCTVHVLHVTNNTVQQEYPESWKYVAGYNFTLESRMLQTAHKYIAAAHARKPVAVQVNTVKSAAVSKAIEEHYMQTGSDLVVMGTHGFSGVATQFLGSNTSSLIAKAKMPVLAVPLQGWKPMSIHALLFSMKLQDVAKRKMEMQNWAGYFKAKLTLLEFVTADEMPQSNKPLKHEGIPLVLKQTTLTKPLAENISRETKNHKHTALVMFVHKRNLIQKIFNSSITGEVSGIIRIPLLALPAL